jgi:hypothetical protein
MQYGGRRFVSERDAASPLRDYATSMEGKPSRWRLRTVKIQSPFENARALNALIELYFLSGSIVEEYLISWGTHTSEMPRRNISNKLAFLPGIY